MVHNLSAQNSLVQQWMHELRSVDIQRDRMRFRRNLERIGEISAYEISKQMDYEHFPAATALGEAETKILAQQPVLATVLRAGLPLHQGILNYFDQADTAFVAAYRRYHRDGSFEIAQNYINCPPLKDRILIIADAMLATGATLLLSLGALLENGMPRQTHVVAVIACNEGIEQVLRKFPDVTIWAGDIDDELTAKGFIVPGLGDAGDLAYGNKSRS